MCLEVRSRIVSKYTCCGCNVIDYNKTKRYFQVRICEHLGISYLTFKTMKIDKNKVTVIKEHHFSVAAVTAISAATVF